MLLSRRLLERKFLSRLLLSRRIPSRLLPSRILSIAPAFSRRRAKEELQQLHSLQTHRNHRQQQLQYPRDYLSDHLRPPQQPPSTRPWTCLKDKSLLHLETVKPCYTFLSESPLYKHILLNPKSARKILIKPHSLFRSLFLYQQMLSNTTTKLHSND